MDFINSLKFIIGLLFLGVASYQDIKERQITSLIWLVMGIISSIFLIFLYYDDFLYISIIMIIYFLWFLDLKKYEKFIDALFFLLLIIVLLFTKENTVLFVDAILLLAYKYLYYTGALGGKADARAIMAITILNPFYPQLFTYFYANRSIVSLIFPYSLEVLFYAAVLNAILFGIYLLIKNLVNRAGLNFKYIFTHIYKNGRWERYQTPFVLSLLIAFILSYIFDLFFFL